MLSSRLLGKRSNENAFLSGSVLGRITPLRVVELYLSLVPLTKTNLLSTIDTPTTLFNTSELVASAVLFICWLEIPSWIFSAFCCLSSRAASLFCILVASIVTVSVKVPSG